MRFPSKGIGFTSGFRRGSAMTFFMPSSRTFRDGQTIQEKTTVSSSLRLTAMGNDVTLPSGTSSPQHSTNFNAPCSLKTYSGGFGVLLVDFTIGSGNGRNKSIDIGHDAFLRRSIADSPSVRLRGNFGDAIGLGRPRRSTGKLGMQFGN